MKDRNMNTKKKMFNYAEIEIISRNSSAFFTSKTQAAFLMHY